MCRRSRRSFGPVTNIHLPAALARRMVSPVLPTNNSIVLRRYHNRDNNEVVECSVVHQNICEFMFLRNSGYITTGEVKMIRTIVLSMCLAASSLSLNARAQDERAYTDGPVTEVDYIGVEYGHFEEYIDWLNSTWKPTMEATKKARLIIDYKVFRLTPKSPDLPNIILWITYKNMAALDKGVEQEAVAKKVIGSTGVQNKARVGRNEYRKVLGSELIRELILK
jgi:hypothetical protein